MNFKFVLNRYGFFTFRRIHLLINFLVLDIHPLFSIRQTTYPDFELPRHAFL